MTEHKHNQGKLNETFNPWKMADGIRSAAAYQVHLESSISLVNAGVAGTNVKGKPLDPRMAEIILRKGFDNITQLLARADEFDFPNKTALIEQAQTLVNLYHPQDLTEQ